MNPDGSKIEFKEMGILIPESLKPGDKIALLSPASAVKEEYVFGAIDRLVMMGYSPVLMPHAIRHEDGNFASSKANRLEDILEALSDKEIKAILCTRGGYGCCQLLSEIPSRLISENPKWLIGFSDISALHALWYRSSVASIHGPMAKHLATLPADDPCTQSLFNLLTKEGAFDYCVSPYDFNRSGKATGILRGGNLAVLNDLCATPCDILGISPQNEDVILFLEDINEPIYKVNRMLWRLLNSGTLRRVKGLIFGQFTDYRPDLNYSSMEAMINDFLENNLGAREIPVAFNFPTGHTDTNYPLTEGVLVSMEVTDLMTRLSTLHSI